MSEAQKVSGKMYQVIPEISGSKGDKVWVKQLFVIETSGQYPKKIAFTAWNDKCDLIPKVGTEVTVSYNPESREYNDKWYTDLSVFDIAVSGEKKAPVKKEPVKTGLKMDEEDDLPF